MRILIVDDDRLVRFSLKSMLNQVANEKLEIFEGVNGEQLVKKSISLQPDIAFVDINMPILDGISAIEQCKEQCPNTKFVILTAYAEFEYAQRSLQIGVQDYLLKPISINQLEKLLRKLSAKIEKDKSAFLTTFQAKTMRLSRQQTASEEEKASSDVATKFYAAASLYIDGAPKTIKEFSLASRLKKLEQTLLEEEIYSSIISLSENLAEIIFGFSNTNDFKIIVDNLHRCYTTQNNNTIITALISPEDYLRSAINQLEFQRENSHLRFTLSPTQINVFPFAGEISSETNMFLKLFSDILTSYKNNDQPSYDHYLLEIEKHFKEIPSSIDLKRLNKFADTLFENPNKNRTYLDLLKHLKLLRKSDVFFSHTVFEDKIMIMKKYVDKNYMHDLSILELSSKFDLTPNYLSSLFHEKIGMTFVKYLTVVRLENAKKILENSPDLPINKLSGMVGYISPRHFSKLFYKQFGIYPSKYKKRK